jgi:hypothetical protein
MARASSIRTGTASSSARPRRGSGRVVDRGVRAELRAGLPRRRTGALNQAQMELMAAHAVLKDQAQVGDATNNIFWLDPWSKDGQKIAAQVRPYTHDLRMHAEAALTLIAQARAAAGPNPAWALRSGPAAVDRRSTTQQNTARPPAHCASRTPSTRWSSARGAWTSSASSSSSPTRWPQATRAPSPTPPAPTARPAPASAANSPT